MKTLKQLAIEQEVKRTMKFVERLYPTPRDSDELDQYNRFCTMLQRYFKSRMGTVWEIANGTNRED